MQRGARYTAVVLLAVAAPVFVPAFAGPEKQNDSLARQFASYPRSAPLDDVIRRHRAIGKPEAKMTQSPPLLFSTWFLDGRVNVAKNMTIDDQGRAMRVRSVYDWAEQASHSWELTAAQQESLRKALRALPPSASSPPLPHLLILSFRDGNRWTTRLYDRTRLPKAVQDLYAITDATPDPTAVPPFRAGGKQ